MSDTPSWELALANYTDEEREQLEAAADAQSDRIEKAAKDPSNTGVVDGIDISELWFAVLRQRDKLGKKAPSTTAKDEDIKPVEPVAPENAAEAAQASSEDDEEEKDTPAPKESEKPSDDDGKEAPKRPRARKTS